MSVTRINRFEAHEGRGEELKELIGSFLPVIQSSAGCLSCQLLQSREEPARLVVIEAWESVEAHQAAAGKIPAETLQAAMGLLAEPPHGEYYSD